MEVPAFSIGEDLSTKNLASIRIDEGRCKGTVFVFKDVNKNLDAEVNVRLFIFDGKIIDSPTKDMINYLTEAAEVIYNDMLREVANKVIKENE